MPSISVLLPRQVTNVNGNNDLYSGWWYGSTAFIIKWAVIGTIFVVCIAVFVGGYIHAKKRMAKGIAPSRWNRWLIPRRTRLAFYQAHPNLPNPYAGRYLNTYTGPNAPYYPGYGEQRSYPMGAMPPSYGPAPPAYGEGEFVPPYAPPEGGSKVAPNQNVHVTETGPEHSTGVVGSSSQGQGHPGGDLGNRAVQQ